MLTKPNQQEPHRLHKSPDVVDRVLDLLDENSSKTEFRELRRSGRYRFRSQATLVELAHPELGWVGYEVPARNLSRQGASLLIGHYVYPSSSCRLHLVSLRNQIHVIEGRVVRCRYLEGSGTLYEVGVKFDQTFDVAMFNREAARLRFLLVNSDQNMRRLTRHWLKSLDVELTCVDGDERALEYITNTRFNLVLLDLPEGDDSNVTLARKLRQRGFAHAVVGLVQQLDEQRRVTLLEAGCSRLLRKPLSCETLEKLVRSLTDRPLYSSQAADGFRSAEVAAFVATLPDTIGCLENAFANNDYVTMITVARLLKNEGAEHGFQPITNAATVVEDAINNLLEPGEIRGNINELVRICSRARAAATG